MVELLHRGPAASDNNAFKRKGDAPAAHSHAASDLPVGTGSNQVAAGDHTHGAAARTIYDAGSFGAAATFTPNRANGDLQRATASSTSMTVATPTGGNDGDTLDVEVTAGAATSITINGTITGITTPQSVANTKVLFLTYRKKSSIWYCLASGVSL